MGVTLMKRNNKLALASALFLVIGLVGYNAYAESTPLAKKLVNMKQDFSTADNELKNIQDPQLSEQKGRELKQKSVEIAQLEKQINPNPEKELEEAIIGLETALEISEKGYNLAKTPENQKALEIVKQKQAMLNDLKQKKMDKTKGVQDLMNDLIKIRSTKEKETATSHNKAP